MDDKTKAIGTVATGAATGGVIVGLPGIIIGIATTKQIARPNGSKSFIKADIHSPLT